MDELGKERQRNERCDCVGVCGGIHPCEYPKLFCKWRCKRVVARAEYETYAEKSADAVAAIVASAERRACQHAPLWPIKVPILRIVTFNILGSSINQTHQSPVTPSRSIGLLSTPFQQDHTKTSLVHLTFARRDEVVLAIFHDIGEAQMRDRA